MYSCSQPPKTHRKHPSMFQNSNWEVIMKFPMISGFLLDFMHLVDGGVIMDWIDHFLEALKKPSDDPKIDKEIDPKDLRQLLTEDIPERAKFLSRFRMLEQTRPLRYLCIKKYWYFILLLFTTPPPPPSPSFIYIF